MSTSQQPGKMDSSNTAKEVEQYLADTVQDGHGYFKSREIASEIGARTRSVAAVIKDVDEMSDRITIKKWAYSNSTTWLVESA